MNAATKLPLSLKQKLQQFKQGYIDLLELNNIHKSRVVSAVLIFFHAMFYVSITSNVQFELFDHTHIPIILNCFKGFIGISSFLFIFSYWIKPTRISEFYFPVLCVGFYSGSLMMVGYIAGMMTILTGVFSIGSILAGLLLFERRIMFYASLPCIVVFYVTSLCNVFGILPYAPLYKPFTMLVAETQNYVILVNLFSTTLISIILVMLFNSFLDRWIERERKQYQLMHLDPLTQLLNRRGIAEQFEQIKNNIQNSQNDLIQAKQLCVAMIDIDYFKRINDQYGHDCGDQVLIKIAKILRLNIRDTDKLGRYGGEEFIIIFDQTALETVHHILERCRKAIARYELEYLGQMVQFTASFGVAESQYSAFNEKELIFIADQALYQAKALGRNQIFNADFV